MADKEQEPKQTTPKGLAIPVPERRDVLTALGKLAKPAKKPYRPASSRPRPRGRGAAGNAAGGAAVPPGYRRRDPRAEALGEAGEHGVQQPPRPEADGSSAASPVSASAAAIASRAPPRRARACSARSPRPRRPRGQRDPLVELDELPQRQDRVARVALDLVCPARWQSTNACGAQPCTSPSVTPEYAGWMSEPCPSTISSSPPRSWPSTTSCSDAPAMKSETTASTAMPQPAIAIPVWPVGTNSAASPRDRASRSSSSDTVIFPIAQSEPTVSTVRAGSLEVRAGRDVEAGRRAARSRSSTLCRARARRARRRRRGTRAARSRRRAPCRCSCAAARATPAGTARPEWRRRRGPCRAEAERVVDRGDDRDAALRLPRPRRVEQRDDLSLPVREHAARGLAVVRVPRVPLSEYEQLLGHPARASRRHLHAVAAARRRATDPRRAAGCRRGRRDRRAAPRSSRPRSPGPTRSCSRA